MKYAPDEDTMKDAGVDAPDEDIMKDASVHAALDALKDAPASSEVLAGVDALKFAPDEDVFAGVLRSAPPVPAEVKRGRPKKQVRFKTRETRAKRGPPMPTDQDGEVKDGKPKRKTHSKKSM